MNFNTIKKFHSLTLFSSIFYTFTNDKITFRNALSPLQYLTILNAILQFLYYENVLTVNVVRKELYFRSIVAPLGILVGIVFWSIFLFDKKSIIPSDANIPLIVNIVLHLNVAIIPIIELCITNNRKSINFFTGWSLLMCVLFFYLTMITVINFYRNTWPYPFMENLNSLQKIGFYSLIFTCASTVYLTTTLIQHKK